LTMTMTGPSTRSRSLGTGGSEPERVPARMVTSSLLPMLGVSPVAGRSFSADDDRAGAAGVALLGDALWRRRFGGDTSAIGRVVTLDNQPYTIVGILPPRFQLLQRADVVLPIGAWAATLPDDRGWHPGIFPVARLRPGIDLVQAQSEMDVISNRLATQYPETNHGVSAEVKPLHAFAVQNVRQSLLVLVAAVGLVLLIACSNVANLLLARAVGRQKEMAIRTAIGASRSRITAQMLVESLLLAACGGLAGLLLATWSVPLLAALAGASVPGAGAIGIDPAALAFTLAISIGTGFFFGLAPALQTTRVDVSAAINEAGLGAGLLTRSLMELQDVSPGFTATGVLVADAPLSPVKYATSAQRNLFVERLRERARSLPGVAFAEVATAPPFSGNGATIHFNITGKPPRGPEEYILTGYRAVSEGYFGALGVPLVAGRLFTTRDRGESSPVAIVNETFVRTFLTGVPRQGIGARARLGTVPDDESPDMEIVG